MKRLLLKNIYGTLICLCCYCPYKAASQSIHPVVTVSQSDSNPDNARLAAVKKYYALALRYKDGDSVAQDFDKAYYYFEKASELGDAQSTYALGYLHYKGLGTTQDYELAARLFRQGAYTGRENSMYFYGLCWRNGYGEEQNEDSAKYWLTKAADLGYKQAVWELQAKTPENSNNDAKKLVRQIHNAALPQEAVLNQFIPVKAELPDSSVIQGDYEGYIIQYDWSGKYVVSSKKLHLSIEAGDASSSAANTGLSGQWLEEGADTAILHATLGKDSLVFADTKYRRKDHYSINRAVTYNFRDAALSLVRKDDSVFLAGSINMFSPERNEPSKPLFVALVRTSADNGNATNNNTTKTKDGSKDSTGKNNNSNQITAKLLQVYPNPFRTQVSVKFELSAPSNIDVQLWTIDGKMVYSKSSDGILNASQYTITLRPGNIAGGTYILRLVYQGGSVEAKVIKK
ncbi:T9SS type A sorting domain-containing protein [Arachidicoccus ginsenosidimutans]|uniref:T9SS type A sorting domain-containing protein n=1 Tax=Arachidicoccus sp. BS20 TaxID=1850526 RepID=UPI0018D46208|nr:T9SS type A sorting domain-containing protein [Arachidicoccus sp. BS20]